MPESIKSIRRDLEKTEELLDTEEKRKRGQAFDLDVTNILQEIKTLVTSEQPPNEIMGQHTS